MNFYQIFLLFPLIPLVTSTSIEHLNNDHTAVEFIVQIEQFPSNSSATFLGVGTLISFYHTLTIKSIFNGLQPPSGVRLRFRSNQLGGGYHTQPSNYYEHSTVDLAILKVAQRVDEQFTFTPLDQSSLLLGRFCTLIGFSQVLVAVPAFVQPCENSQFCVTRRPSEFSSCGGFSGSPVICDGEAVCGLTKSDELCDLVNPRVILIDLSDHLEWIKEISGCDKNMKISAVFVMVLVVLGKVF